MWKWINKLKNKWLNNYTPTNELINYTSFNDDMNFHYENIALAYANNPIVHRAISLLADSVGSVKWKIYTNNNRIVRYGPLHELLLFPNMIQSWNDIIKNIVLDLCIFGNAYIYLTNENRPLSIYLLRPFRVTIIPGQYGIPTGYEYALNNEKQIIKNNIDKPNILHIKMPNPYHDWYGMSPLNAAKHALTQYSMMANHNLSTMHNSGKPSGCLVLRNKYGLTDKQRQELREKLSNIYQGTHNAGKIFIAEGDFDWKEIDTKTKDIDYSQGQIFAAIQIAITLGIQPTKLGIRDERLTNYKESNVQFGEETLIPMIDKLIEAFNWWIQKICDHKTRFGYDKNEINALLHKRSIIWDMVNKADFLTKEEKRSFCGYSTVDE